MCGSSLPRTSTLRDAIARAGPLPKEWPQSLSNLNLYWNKFTRPIPVELLRWKFVERRTIQLTGNAGLELPSNIGELGDSVTQIAWSGHDLRGVCHAQHPVSIASSEMRSRAQGRCRR